MNQTQTKIFHFCVPLWNRGNDISMLLENLNKIYSELDRTKITFTVTISDFHSDDIDLEQKKKEIDFPLRILYLDGRFNIALSLQNSIDSITKESINDNDIILLCDADAVFDDGVNLLKEISEQVIQGKTYYCPIVSTEAKPTWRCNFNGKIYVPVEDHWGCGTVATYVSDIKRTGGYHGSDFLGTRGEEWGGHDSLITSKLKGFLVPVRNIESRIWVRSHVRPTTNYWYRKAPTIYHGV